MLDLAADDPRATALVSAIQTGDVDRLRSLLDQDPALATASIVDDRNVARTLLHIVTDWPGHFAEGARTAALLIEPGADVNARERHRDRDEAGETPLHWAASCDDVALVDALLDGGADIEAPGAIFTGGAPMSDAVVFAQWKAARRLLERGARTTFWQASALGPLDPVREFFTNGSAPTPEDITNAFWNACRGGQQPVAAFLLSQGADLNWIGHDDKMPLQVAQESGAEDLVAWLRAQAARS